LAKSLLAGHGFSLDGVPFFFRTIGYPLFLAGGLAVFRSTIGFILFQIFLASFTPLVVLRLGKQLHLGKKAAWIAAWIAALEPHLVYYSVTILTESMYTLIFLIGLIYIFRTMETMRVTDSLRAGIAFGVGMLIKPLLQFFPFILFFFMLPWSRRIHWKMTIKHTVIILATIFIILVPWMYRNDQVFHSWSLSSQGPNAALFYLGTSIVSVRDQLTYQDAEAKVKQEFVQAYGNSMTPTERSAASMQAAIGYIKENPGILARLIAINTFTFWTSSNYNGFLNYYRLIPRIDHSVLPPTHYLAQGRIGDLFGSFWKIFSQPFYAIGVFGRLIWLAITFFFITGLIAAYRRIPDRRLQLVFLLALCAYMTAVVWVDGLGIESRLRYPLMPIEFLYAAYGGLIFFERFRHKKLV
ncbi:MAG: glycosyltransferase family 39 protein, partial [Candidatus Uhrbacteria bacterium]|nr:glycosyltransferase family 39 protein [Candidatus Uhrbacteria bacterium]